MTDNTNLLKHLLANSTIRLKDSELLYHPPPSLPDSFRFEKIEGMLLGLAIGDALGAPSEGKLPAERRERYGNVTDYLDGRRGRGMGTDDTQLAFWTLEELIADRGLVPEHLAQKFCEHHIWGIGSTTRQFIGNYKDRHIPWHEAGLDSLGNGALMRIAPVVVPYLCKPTASLYADAAIDTMITHNSFGNIASCVAFVKMLWLLLGMKSPPEPQWWVDAFCSNAQMLEGSTRYHPKYPRHATYEGPVWQFTRTQCEEALRKGLDTEEACSRWGSGANLFETVPSVIYILARHGHNPEEAITRAVNDTKDNDTVAAIVGAAVGALHGLEAIPDRWIKGLKGVIREGGGGAVFRAIFHAKQVFWLNP
jgi:ADP-ribosylglycohydrolase